MRPLWHHTLPKCLRFPRQCICKMDWCIWFFFRVDSNPPFLKKINVIYSLNYIVCVIGMCPLWSLFLLLIWSPPCLPSPFPTLFTKQVHVLDTFILPFKMEGSSNNLHIGGGIQNKQHHWSVLKQFNIQRLKTWFTLVCWNHCIILTSAGNVKRKPSDIAVWMKINVSIWSHFVHTT